MTLVDYPAKLYFAGDIPTEVHGRVEYAFSIIQEKLGKYPVEVYLLELMKMKKTIYLTFFVQTVKMLAILKHQRSIVFKILTIV